MTAPDFDPRMWPENGRKVKQMGRMARRMMQDEAYITRQRDRETAEAGRPHLAGHG